MRQWISRHLRASTTRLWYRSPCPALQYRSHAQTTTSDCRSGPHLGQSHTSRRSAARRGSSALRYHEWPRQWHQRVVARTPS